MAEIAGYSPAIHLSDKYRQTFCIVWNLIGLRMNICMTQFCAANVCGRKHISKHGECLISSVLHNWNVKTWLAATSITNLCACLINITRICLFIFHESEHTNTFSLCGGWYFHLRNTSWTFFFNIHDRVRAHAVCPYFHLNRVRGVDAFIASHTNETTKVSCTVEEKLLATKLRISRIIWNNDNK